MTEIVSQEKELSDLKVKYGSKIRVIKDVGDFTYVINFRPENMDIAVKFQLLGELFGFFPLNEIH